MKFRKKPVVIEAYNVKDLLFLAKGAWYSLPLVIRDAYERGEMMFSQSHISLLTLEGWMNTTSVDDWIIEGVKGELYSCRADIFKMTYEKVEE